MDCDYADQLDLEWQCLLQGHLKSFSCQKERSKLYLFDEVLEKVFCRESEAEQEVNYKDKEICEKCLAETLQFLSGRTTLPRQSQICFLLNTAKYAARDETCFINLKANNVLSGVIYFSQNSNVTSDKNINILILELLHSFLEHYSGVKALIESKYWTFAYNLMLYNQKVDEDITKRGYKFLTKLLAKTNRLDKNFCYEVIQPIVDPLLNAARVIEIKNHHTTIESLQLVKGLRPSILCLVEILEILLEEYNAGVLKCITNLKVDLASDTISKITKDKSICLVLDRITLILSFFKLTDVLDGIKSISEDPLAVTGFLRIVEFKVDKGAVDLIFELCYYCLKYLKSISEKLPKYTHKDRKIDIETEIVVIQMAPIMLISEKLDYQQLIKSLDADLVRQWHLSKLIQKFSLVTLNVVRKIKEALPAYPFEVYSNSVKYVIQSRHLYSKDQLASAFEGLIYSLQDTIDHIKMNTEKANETDLQRFISELMDAILLFIESFNLNWSDSVKILELTEIMNGGNTYQWPATIVIQGCKLLQEIVTRRLSPAMSLLIDSNEDLKEFGPLMYQKCFTTEWEVRKAILDVVHTIAVSANKSFPSFKSILFDASLPNLISTMALNDEKDEVKAAAFKCLHEIFVMHDIEEILPKNCFINKVLDLLVGSTSSAVKKEALTLITIAYLHRNGLQDQILPKVYKYLEHVTLTNPDGAVKVGALQFWGGVVKKYLASQGWMDQKFPSVTFSKRIVCMTNKEIQKRIYRVLTQLGEIGFLNTFVKISNFENLPSEADRFINAKLFCFNSLFREHEVTPESMLFYEESISNNSFVSPPNSVGSSGDSDEVIQEIIDNTVMKMIPDEPEFLQDEDLYSLIESRFSFKNTPPTSPEPIPERNRQVTPSEFVEFIYKKVAYLATIKDDMEYIKDCPGNQDIYNIIDY